MAANDNFNQTFIQIVTRFKNGDQKAFNDLYSITHNRIYFIALKELNNHDDALEAVQETYLSVYQSIDKLKNPEFFQPWLSKIVYNKCMDILRKKKDILMNDRDEAEGSDFFDEIEEPGDELIPHEALDRTETRDMIMALIDKLSYAQRMTVLLYYYQNLSIEQIASIMQCPVPTVKSRLNYARQQIKTGVEGYEKQGIKLYGSAIGPILVYLLSESAKRNVLNHAQATAILSSISAGSHAMAQTTAVGGGKAAWGKRLLHKIAAWPVKKKIIAGAVAAVMTVSAVTIPITIYRNTNDNSAVNTVGNTPGNIANDAVVAQQGDWIYYTDVSGDNYLYKIKTDGTGKTQLNNERTQNINVVGEWVYYISNDNDFEEKYLYKIKTNGSNKMKLNNDVTGNITVMGDWIYYINNSDDDRIYKIRTDGTNRTKICGDAAFLMTIVDDWIYYSNISDDNGYLYKIKTDGTGKLKLNNERIWHINVSGDWIYYTVRDRYIYKIKTDGTNKTKICQDKCMGINVFGDWIYYEYCNNAGKDNKLCKIRTDGTEKTILLNNMCLSVNFADGWLYYIDVAGDKSVDITLNKIRTDGTQNQIVN